MARPIKYDQTTAEVLLKAVAAGLPNKTAAELAGIDERTLYNWKRRGKAGEEPFLQFLQSLRAHQARAVREAMQTINHAAKRGEWRAAAWWLERRHPDEYGSERKRIRELEKMLAEIIRTSPARPPATPRSSSAAAVSPPSVAESVQGVNGLPHADTGPTTGG